MRTPEAGPSTGARVFSWTGGAVFVASLGYFLYSYLIVFGQLAENAGTLTPATINVALFSAFALHHSIFAREGARAWVTHIFRGLERSVYVWVASLLFAATCCLWRPVPGLVWDVREPVSWGLRILQLIGLWLSLRSAGIIDVWKLAGIGDRGSGIGDQDLGSRFDSDLANPDPGSPIPDPQSPIPDPEFRAAGPYAWVRHPIYLGWFLLVLGVPRMTMTQFVFAVVSSAYVLIAIPFEERSLRRTSGGAYQRYEQEVRWKLVPYIF